MDIKIEIKQEPVWLEEIHSEVTYSHDGPQQNEVKVKEENQETEVDISLLNDIVAVEQLPVLPLDPYRFPAEVLSALDPSISLVFDGAALAAKCMLEEKTRTANKENTKRCEICGKVFRQALLLKKHALQHELKEFHQCELCEATFTAIKSLNRHYFTHKTKALFKCHVCGKAFIYVHNLRFHKLSHKRKRYFSCDVCKKGFSSKSVLREHGLTHR